MALTEKGRKLRNKAVVVVVLLIGLAIADKAGILDAFLDKGLPSRQVGQATVPQQVNLPSDPLEASNQVSKASSTPIDLPLGALARLSTPPINAEVMKWNAQANVVLANGGPSTTEGSQMAKEGVNLRLINQDDTVQMQTHLIATAEAVCNGKPLSPDAVHMIAVMGDGTAALFQAINPVIAKFDKNCLAEIFDVSGFSNGEDKFMGQPQWKLNAQAAKGALIAGVVKDGDWNIALKWAGDNKIENNPDFTTYYADGLNWVNVPDFKDASLKYNTNYCEDRDEVVRDPMTKKLVKTGQKVNKCVNGVVTWTPGDVSVVSGQGARGGLVTILSTKENVWQMPDTFIGINKWNTAHAREIEGFIRARSKAADMMKSSDEAVRLAGKLSYAVYHDQNPEYWYRYFKGTREKDRMGYTVDLGGSRVSNINDTLRYFGLMPGADNKFAQVYKSFGDIVKKQYPKDVPTYPAYDKVVNLTYMKNAAQTTESAPASLPQYTDAPIATVTGEREYTITFNTGQWTFTPEGQVEADRLYADVSSHDQKIEIHGYTDNTGSRDSNLILGQHRADTIKSFLQSKSATDYNDKRVKAISHGQDDPVADNSTPEGRAQNRRVIIRVGTTY